MGSIRATGRPVKPGFPVSGGRIATETAIPLPPPTRSPDGSEHRPPYTPAMFTGLVQHVGRVASIRPSPAGATLVIDPMGWDHHPAQGDSIAISGCCLTVAAPAEPGRVLGFDVIHQTLRLTTLGGLKPGDRVNLEHAATPTTLLGGHIVQGHVDGVGQARRVETETPGEWRVRIECPLALRRYLSPRGSVAVDGVSLTIAAVVEVGFEVALIPTTLQRTTLGGIGPTPRPVNLEVDALVKAVVYAMEQRG